MALDVFYEDFAKFYAPFSLIFCLFGVPCNVLMAIVLTRPAMSSNVVNRLMAFAACMDAGLMAVYFVYSARFKYDSSTSCPADIYTYAWTIYQAAYADFSVYARACSLWLSAAVAGYRKKSLISRIVEVDANRSRIVSRQIFLSVAVAVLFLSTPIFLQNTVEEGERAPIHSVADPRCPSNHSQYYVVRPPGYALLYNGLLLKTCFYINALALKLIPCAVLAYYLLFIVVIMYRHRDSRKDRGVLRDTNIRYRSSPAINAADRAMNRCKTNQSQIRGNKTLSPSPKRYCCRKFSAAPWSVILCVLLCATLLCESPNAVLSVWNAVDFGSPTAQWTYVNLGDLLDFLSLLQCNSTSILYCSMSRRFRRTLVDCVRKACRCDDILDGDEEDDDDVDDEVEDEDSDWRNSNDNDKNRQQRNNIEVGKFYAKSNKRQQSTPPTANIIYYDSAKRRRVQRRVLLKTESPIMMRHIGGRHNHCMHQNGITKQSNDRL